MLYKKYYPKTFDDILSNEKIKEILQIFLEYNSIKNLIINGPGGCGKSTLMKIFLKELKNKGKYRILEINSNDLISKLEVVIEKVKLYGNKIIFIDNCTDLTIQQQNNLNILTNEARKTNFIICTNNISNLTKTIQTKFLIMNYERVKNDKLFEYFKQICLKENINCPEEKLRNIIFYSNYDFRKIINTLSIHEDVEYFYEEKINNIFNLSNNERIKVITDIINLGYCYGDIIHTLNILVNEKYKNNYYDIEKFKELILEITKIKIRINEGNESLASMIFLILLL